MVSPTRGEVDTSAPAPKVTFPSGAERGSDTIKGWHMLSQIALRRYADAMTEGASKYKPYNWLKGIPVTNQLDHLYSHLAYFLQGDSSEDHLGHALWNLAAIVHYSETRLDLFEGLPPGCKDAMIEFLQCTDEGSNRPDAVPQATPQPEEDTTDRSPPTIYEQLQGANGHLDYGPHAIGATATYVWDGCHWKLKAYFPNDESCTAEFKHTGKDFAPTTEGMVPISEYGLQIGEIVYSSPGTEPCRRLRPEEVLKRIDTLTSALTEAKRWNVVYKRERDDALEGIVAWKFQFKMMSDEFAKMGLRAEKAEKFKQWVHTYLDNRGIPKDPGGPHTAEGCRIGDRMDYIFKQPLTFSVGPRLAKWLEEQQKQSTYRDEKAERPCSVVDAKILEAGYTESNWYTVRGYRQGWDAAFGYLVEQCLSSRKET